MPRAAAIASVTSWSGPAAPSSDAVAVGQVGRLGDDDPAGRREGLGDQRRGVRPEDRRGAHPERRGRGERLAGALGPRVEPGALGEDEQQRRLGPGRGQVAVEERLEVADRRRHPRGLLDLERELARGDPVHAGADDEQVRGGGDRSRRWPRRGATHRRLRRARPRCPARTRAPERPGARRAARERRGGRGRGDDRRHVADGVAPAAVHLDRRERDVRARRPPVTRALAGDQRRRGAVPATGGHRRPSSPSSRPRG